MSKLQHTISVALVTLIVLCCVIATPAMADPPSQLKKVSGESGIPGIKAPTVSEYTTKVVTGVDSITKKKVVSLEEAKVNDTSSSEEEEEEDPSIIDGLNPFNMGKKMVGEGGMYFLELLGDAGFKVGMNNTDSDTNIVKEDYGQAVAMIYELATIEFDPSKNPFIQELQIRFGLIGLFLMMFFLLLGGIHVNIGTMISKQNVDRAYILSTRYHIPINEYALTIIEACLMMSLGYVILRITILMELMFTKMIMFEILDRIAPTGGNTVMYLMMALCYLIIGIAIAYRILIIGMFHATYIAFIGLYCFGVTREVSIAAFWYYIKILFLRPIIVAITSIGVGIISYIGPIGGAIDPFSKAGQALITLLIHPILYAALVLILVIVCIMFILGVKNVISATKIAARKYTYGVYH